MLKLLEALTMVICAYVGFSSAYILMRFKVRVYTGGASSYILESATYRTGCLGGPRTLISESNEPKEITYTLVNLFAEGFKAFAWIAVAVWFGTRLFAR